MLSLISADNVTCLSLCIKTLAGEGETASHKEPVPLVVKEVSANVQEE